MFIFVSFVCLRVGIGGFWNIFIFSFSRDIGFLIISLNVFFFYFSVFSVLVDLDEVKFIFVYFRGVIFVK